MGEGRFGQAAMDYLRNSVGAKVSFPWESFLFFRGRALYP